MRARGFTLLELLVALAIFAVLSVMAYGGLRNVLDTRAQVEVEAARLTALQTTFTLIERDVEQVLARSVRDNFGDVRPALIGGGDQLLEFTHAGLRNPVLQARSQLQRVVYQLKDGHLQRLTWPMLDRAPNSEPQQADLLGGIAAVEILFYDQNLAPQREWPLPVTGNTTVPQILPRAVEVSIELDGWGRVTRLLRVVDVRT